MTIRRFEGRRALVSGGTSGIGRAVALRLGAEGARVAFTGRREARLQETAAALRAAGGEPLPIACDHTDGDQNQRCIEQVVDTFGGLDVLVNAAGVIGNDGLLAADPRRWRRVMDVNVEAVYDLWRRATPHLVAAAAAVGKPADGGPGAAVVNVSSVTGLRPYPSLLAYCTSKAAIDMMTQVAALELAPYGVRVNAVCPGVVVTELHTVSGAVQDYPAFLERSRTTHPLGRTGQPEEVAALVAFLASAEAAWITGAIVSIDGGRALTSLR
jgi:NAD(P)-dependent dehydrogenase (short-subunit alcohol dehydrogenase family)